RIRLCFRPRANAEDSRGELRVRRAGGPRLPRSLERTLAVRSRPPLAPGCDPRRPARRGGGGAASDGVCAVIDWFRDPTVAVVREQAAYPRTPPYAPSESFPEWPG